MSAEELFQQIEEVYASSCGELRTLLSENKAKLEADHSTHKSAAAAQLS